MEKAEMEAVAKAINEALKPVVENLTAILGDIAKGKKPEEKKEEEDSLSKGVQEYVDFHTNPENTLKGKDISGSNSR